MASPKIVLTASSTEASEYKHSIRQQMLSATIPYKFGNGIKYPLWRFAGWPDRFLRKHLYLDFAGRKRNKGGMQPFEKEIIPGFESVLGLNMIDASQLHHAQIEPRVGLETVQASGD